MTILVPLLGDQLYWGFLDRNQDRLRSNRRLRYPYATWDRMDEEKRAAYRDQAARFLSRLQPPEDDWVH